MSEAEIRWELVALSQRGANGETDALTALEGEPAMSSILKRSLVVAAIVGVGVVPSSAMAAHTTDHNPPGQACKTADPGDRGECASAAAKQNKVDRNASTAE